MAGYQTADRPRPLFSTARPPTPIVPIERCRPPVLAACRPGVAELEAARPIKEEIARKFNITVADLENYQRDRRMMEARHAAYRALHAAYPHWSVAKFGLAMGKQRTAAKKALRKLGLL